MILNDNNRKHERKERGLSRRDATFSEIYELIYYNENLVRSEFKVLQNLVEKKLKNSTTPGLFQYGRRS